MNTRKVLTIVLSVLVLPILFTGITNTVSASGDNVTKHWAVIVCGSTGMSFQNNTDYMYHVLKEHYCFDGIHYLSVDPTHAGVNGDSTKANVRSAFTNWLKTRSDDDDMIFIYMCSHGGGYDSEAKTIVGGRYDENGDEGNEVHESTLDKDLNGDCDKCDWVGIDESIEVHDSFYWDDELASDLNTLNYGKLIFVRQGCVEIGEGCFGGGLIDDISACNRIIMTATDETHYSYADGDGDGFSEWSEVFIDALHGENTHCDKVTGLVVNESPREYVDADKNNDGHVSMKEAWEYAWDNDSARPDETPWLDDNGNGLPTYINETDKLDPSDGTLAACTWLPLCPKPVVSCDIDGNEKNAFLPGETVYVKCSGFVASKAYKVWIQHDAVKEDHTLNSADDPSGSQESVTADGSGNIPITAIWAIPSDATGPPECWDIIVDKQDDGPYTGKFNLSSDGIDDASTFGFVAPVPEMPVIALFGIGLIGIAGYWRFSKSRNRLVKAN